MYLDIDVYTCSIKNKTKKCMYALPFTVSNFSIYSTCHRINAFRVGRCMCARACVNAKLSNLSINNTGLPS